MPSDAVPGAFLFWAFAWESHGFARRHDRRRATGLPLRKRRQCGGHHDWQQRYGFQGPSGARGAAVAYADVSTGGFHDSGISSVW